MFQVALLFYWQQIKVVLNLKKNEAVFHFQKFSFKQYVRSSSFFLNEVIFHFQKKWVRLPFPNKWGCLPFPKKLRSSSIWNFFSSSSIFQNIEVVFLISSYWVNIRLHTENQLPKLSRTVLIVMGPSVVVVWWWCGGVVFLPIIIPPQLKLFWLDGWVLAIIHWLEIG